MAGHGSKTGRKRVIREIVAEMQQHIQEMDEELNNPERDRLKITDRCQKALFTLSAPLVNNEYKYLLEKRQGPSSDIDMLDVPEQEMEVMSKEEIMPVDDHHYEQQGGASQDEDISESDAEYPNNTEYVFRCSNNRLVYAWEYLGEEWTEWIEKLHSLPEIPSLPPGLVTEPHPWQKIGCNKLVHLAKSRFRGAILGDEMGLGKTLTIIMTAEMLRKERGAFNLVVCPKSCMEQWKEELLFNFEPRHRPKVKILNDPKISVCELLDEEVDYVICTYQFVQARWAELSGAKRAFEELEEHTVECAEEFTRTTKRSTFKRRPIASLHSEVYRQLDLPIRCMILDEGQMAKSEQSKTWQALQNINRRYTFVLSGTLFANRWSDAFGAISFLKGHPFRTRAAFQSAFAAKEGNSTITNPTASKEARLVKFLLGLVIARPASLLKLPNIHEHDCQFGIGDHDLIRTVLQLVENLYEALRSAKLTSPGSMEKESRGRARAVLYATIAQQLVAHPDMLTQKDQERVKQIKAHAAATMDRFVKKYSDLSANSPEFYMAVLEDLDKYYIKTTPIKSQDEADPAIVEHDDRHDEPLAEAGGEANSNGNRMEQASLEEHSREEFLKKVAKMDRQQLQSPRIRELLATIIRISKIHPGEKILVFSRFLKFLDIAERALQLELTTLPVFRYDGTVTGRARPARVNAFSTEVGTAVMLITAGCGGVGLNLTAASHVIQCEPWWREMDEKQAYSRAARFRQIREVHIWKLISYDGIIDHVLKALSRSKGVVIDRITLKIRFPDGQVPEIPKQYKGSAGEGL